MNEILIDETTGSISDVIQRTTVYAVILGIMAMIFFALAVYINKTFMIEVSKYFYVFLYLWIIAIFYAPIWSILSLVVILGYKDLWHSIRLRKDTVLRCVKNAAEKPAPKMLYITYFILMILGLLDLVYYIYNSGSNEIEDLYFFPVLLSRNPITSITCLGLVIVAGVSLLFCFLSKYIFLTDSKIQILKEEQEEYVQVNNAYDDEDSL